MKVNRTIILGLDGVPYSLLQNLAQKRIMPNTARLISNDIFRKMQSSLPEVSSVAWSSIITGANPAEHGIFGFTELDPHSYEMCFPNYNDLKKTAFWDSITETSVIINVPATYPVRKMNGVHISGFVSVDYEKSVYPQSLISRLREFDYRLDVDSGLAHKSMDLFLKDLEETHEAQIKTYRHLWKTEDWALFMLVFTGTDRLMHFLWDAYEDKDHRYHQAFLDYFRKIDEVIGEIDASRNENDAFLMLSDHGFEHLEKDIYVNYLLRKEGYLEFEKGAEREWNNLSFMTKAFALDPARIYIHEKGKYARGSVSPSDKNKILHDVQSLFSSLTVDGVKVIDKIYRKEEIYTGALMHKAPDLVMTGSKGFNLKSNPRYQSLEGKSIFSGKHTYENAFILINRQNILQPIPDQIYVSDVFKIIKNNCDLFDTNRENYQSA